MAPGEVTFPLVPLSLFTVPLLLLLLFPRLFCLTPLTFPFALNLVSLLFPSFIFLAFRSYPNTRLTVPLPLTLHNSLPPQPFSLLPSPPRFTFSSPFELMKQGALRLKLGMSVASLAPVFFFSFFDFVLFVRDYFHLRLFFVVLYFLYIYIFFFVIYFL